MGGGREARKAEAAVKKKLIADAQVALGKIEAAHSAEALAAAIKAAQPFLSAASLQQALPAAKQRLASLTAQADKAVKSDFLSRVDEASTCEEQGRGAPQKVLRRGLPRAGRGSQQGVVRRRPVKGRGWASSEGIGCKGFRASLRPKLPPALACVAQGLRGV